jgi:hypothetical protein
MSTNALLQGAESLKRVDDRAPLLGFSRGDAAIARWPSDLFGAWHRAEAFNVDCAVPTFLVSIGRYVKWK